MKELGDFGMKKLMIFIQIVVISMIYQVALADNNTMFFEKIKEEHKTQSETVGISVNSKEEIAIGFDDGFINIYNSNGKFVTGYSYKTYGSYYFKYDDTDNLMIFDERAGRCYFFNYNAELVKTSGFSNTTEEDRFAWSLYNIKKVNFNGTIYELKESFRDIKLTKTDTTGNITTIYYFERAYKGEILFYITVLLYLIIGYFVILKKNRKIIETDGTVSKQGDGRLCH